MKEIKKSGTQRKYNDGSRDWSHVMTGFEDGRELP